MGLLALIGLGVFGVMFIGGIMGIVAHARVGKLELQVKNLQTQLHGAPEIKFTPSMRPEVTPRPKRASVKTIHKPTVKQVRQVTPVRSPRPEKPKKRKRSFEEEIGARWAVWVGGIALAFGAIFLLRYTIEAGVFSPGLRIALASLMGIVLLGAGEFLRRVDGKNIKLPEALAGLKQTAYIPGVLTGVGIFTLLGTSYAAYELYNFIGPLVTFVLLATISTAALALSLLHGPKMAALGLVASLVTPLLVDMGTPNYFILYTYLIVVSITALALAWKRDWSWLNVLTLFGALGWSFISVAATEKSITYGAWLIYTGLMFALSTYIAHNHDEQFADTKPKKGLRHNNVSACVWAGIGAALMYLVVVTNVAFATPPDAFDFLHVYIAIVFSVIIMAVGSRFPMQKANILIGGIAGTTMVWFGAECDIGTATSLVMGSTIAGLAAFLSFLNAKQALPKTKQYVWSGFGAGLPIIMFVALHLILSPPNTATCYLNVSECEVPSFGGQQAAIILFIIAVANAMQSWLLWRKDGGKLFAVSVYVIGTAIAYILAVLIGFSGLTETILLMFGILISAAIYTRIAIPALRWTAAGFALLSAAHTLFMRIGESGALSERLIINELWIYFALPALLCAGAAWLLSPRHSGIRHQDICSEGLKALTLTFAALFFIFQIRHFMNGGNILSSEFGFDEMALQVMVGLSFTLGGTLLGRPKLGSAKQDGHKREPYELLIPGLAMGISVATLALFVLGICFRYNPLLSDDVVIKGGAVINSLALAYLLPAVALGAIAWLSRAHRPKAYIQATSALSLVAFMLYLTTTVRVLFTGSKISLWDNPFKDAELYAISAAWLAFGIVLLVAGLKFKQKDIRMASALVITLTVLKAFLIDMASLEGVLRAMSFVVLGLVLIVIGRVYQKLLFSKTNEDI